MSLNRIRDGVAEFARSIAGFQSGGVGDYPNADSGPQPDLFQRELISGEIARPERDERCSFSTWRSRACE